MHNTIPEIAVLLREVEKRYGWKINTSTDFESLSVVIERDINEYISASTLKRLWGYVSLKPAPRVATLDILSRFCGYGSFGDFREHLKSLPDMPSDFFSTTCLSSADLKPGETVFIGWAPNRLVKLQYLGKDSYRVVESQNAKLQVGDVFRVSQFLLGYPLYVDQIDRAGDLTPSYVAGKNGGLNQIERG